MPPKPPLHMLNCFFATCCLPAFWGAFCQQTGARPGQEALSEAELCLTTHEKACPLCQGSQYRAERIWSAVQRINAITAAIVPRWLPDKQNNISASFAFLQRLKPSSTNCILFMCFSSIANCSKQGAITTPFMYNGVSLNTQEDHPYHATWCVS